MRSKKLLVIGICAAAVIAIVLCAALLPKKEEALFAMAAKGKVLSGVPG